VQISRLSPLHSTVLPAFQKFWDELVPAISYNSTPMVKRMLIAGKGMSFFSKI
jgi:hypothetical protein